MRTFVLLLVLAACTKNPAAQPQHEGPVVVHIGNEILTTGDMKARLATEPRGVQNEVMGYEFRRAWVERVARNEAMLQEAQQRGLENAPEVREAARREMIKLLLKQVIEEKTVVTDAEIQKVYDQNAAAYHQPERIKIAVDGVETQPYQSREQMAQTHSQAIADAAFSMKDYESRKVAGHQVTVLGRLPAEVKPLADVKERIRAELARQKNQAAYDAYVKSLDAKVQIDDDALKKFSPR